MKKSIKPNAIASPMMVMVISTYHEDGTPNAMTAAWGGVLDTDLIVLSLDKSHKTAANILKRNAFCIGFPSVNDIADCDYVGIVSANKVPDKLINTQLKMVPSTTVDAPVCDNFPMTLECVTEKVFDDEEYGFYVIGRIKNILVEEDCCLEKGVFDVAKMDLCFYTSLDNTYRRFGEAVGKAFSIGNPRRK